MLRTREQELESEIKQRYSELEDLRGRNRGFAPSQENMKNAYADCPTVSAGYACRQETPQEKIDYLFTFHDDPDKAPHFVEIREAAKSFALVVLRHASAGSSDQRTAIEHIRQAVMFANASVALNGRGL